MLRKVGVLLLVVGLLIGSAVVTTYAKKQYNVAVLL